MSLISNFMYKKSNPLLAWYISEITQLALLLFSTMVVFRIYFKLKRVEFNYNSDYKLVYDEVLLIIGLGAIYLFELYSIIAVLNNGIDGSEYLSFAVIFMTVIESTFQSVLIIDSLKKSTEDKELKKLKPGRSLITALILIDLSLWLIETFSARKYDMKKIELEYYNIVFWSIVNSISSPLAIFFHFHAGVCLSEKWEELYD